MCADENFAAVDKSCYRFNDFAIEWEIDGVNVFFNSHARCKKREGLERKARVQVFSQSLGQFEITIKSGVDYCVIVGASNLNADHRRANLIHNAGYQRRVPLRK